VLVILYLIHPSITRYALSLYYCMELDEGESWLYRDLQVRCWQGSHRTWAIGIGVPMIIIWVIGAPLLGFAILTRNFQSLEDPHFFS